MPGRGGLSYGSLNLDAVGLGRTFLNQEMLMAQ